ncbi:MAG: hypothetical protein JOZ43_09180 [Acidobacteriales bacterium]|nr:hypothetical protein [Terriglobales bacterium]
MALVLGLLVFGIALLGLRDGNFALPITRAGVMISGWIAQILNIALLLFGLLLLYGFICSLRKVDENDPDRSR